MGKSKSSSDLSTTGSTADQDLKKPENSGVAAWLGFLQMDTYLADFIDNGYDDLETAKKIGSEDLEAIGVEDPNHKVFLLDAVRVLREQGAAWVYLLEASPEFTTHLIQADPGDRASAGSSGIASLPWTDHDNSSSGDNSTCSSSRLKRLSQPRRTQCQVEVTPEHHRVTASLPGSGSSPLNSRLGGKSHNGRLVRREEELDLIQRVSEMGPKKFCDRDFLHLNLLVKDKLNREGISLAAPPFTTKAGDGYLAGLAARFSAELHVDEDDVLHQLEDMRSASMASNWMMTTSRRLSESHNYANYPETDKNFMPGIYASSSCLSDKDEDDIYDFAAKYEGVGKLLRGGNKPSKIFNSSTNQGWCKLAKKAMTLRRPEGQAQPLYNSSSAFSSPVPSHQGFSTRTRLRPGGPLKDSHPGSLPSFEEIGMRPSVMTVNRRPLYNNGLQFGNQQPPATPLVKQKTAGCSSPRVQMYRTRVVYSDVRDALKAAQEAAV